jgi:methionine-rich copper-binding protein CopC
MTALFAFSASAFAHARYSDSTPGRSEVVATSPSTVSITFTQEVQRVSGTYSISVTDAGGAEYTSGPAVIDDADRTMMSAPLQPAMPPGRYVVAFTNVSDADGDPYEGAFSFYVGVEPTEEDRAADAALQDDEETPVATTPVEPSPTAGDQATPEPTAGGNGDDADDGGDNNALIWVGAAILAGVIIGGVGYVLVRRSRA